MPPSPSPIQHPDFACGQCRHALPVRRHVTQHARRRPRAYLPEAQRPPHAAPRLLKHSLMRQKPCATQTMRMRDTNHALTCPKLSSVRTLHHDTWTRYCAMRRTAPEVVPKVREMQTQPGVRRHEDAARGDEFLATWAGRHAGHRWEHSTHACGDVPAGHGGRR